MLTMQLLSTQHHTLHLQYVTIIIHLFKAGSYSEGNVDEDRSHMSLVNLLKDPSKAGHGFHGDEVSWVLSVIHTCQHC